VNAENYVVRYSEIVDLNPIITCSLDILCLAFLAYFRYFKTTWSVQNRKDKIRNLFFAVLYITSVVIFTLSIFQKTTPFIADLLRPFVVINFLGSMRSQLGEFSKDLKSSLTILLTIFAWIFLYSLMGFYLFRYSFEGATSFSTMRQSYMSMLTLLTTANFPDVMLPSYHRNYFFSLFFISYLLIGLYFLLSLLLASVFNKFKFRFTQRI